MKPNDIKELFRSFNKMKVLIVGDSMIDAYMWGKIERQSPEAPVPIVEIKEHENRLGGAGNVARNIKSLGAKPILCSVVGKDHQGDQLKKLLKKEGLSTTGIFTDKNRKTTVKTRIISENKHQLRVDEEDTTPIVYEKEFLHKVMSEMKTSDVIIMQDYNKGVLTPWIIKNIIRVSGELNIPTIIDPKNKNFLAYKNCSIFKPNLNEIRLGYDGNFDKNSISEIKKVTKNLLNTLDAKAILLTLSEKGICLQTQNQFIHINALKRKIIDVSGAGDTVISIAAVCLAANIPPLDISQFSNLAGGLVCEEVGVVPINKKKLEKEAISTLSN